jgi:hypothetical protein
LEQLAPVDLLFVLFSLLARYLGMVGIRKEVESTYMSCGLLKDMMEACAAQVESVTDTWCGTAGGKDGISVASCHVHCPSPTVHVHCWCLYYEKEKVQNNLEFIGKLKIN